MESDDIRSTDLLGGFRDAIVCGDNCEVMRKMPTASIDLVLTSPPYDGLREYGGHEWDFDGVAMEIVRLLKPGGVCVWVVGDATVDGSETGTSFEQALGFKRKGLRLHDTMIYQKNSPPLTHNRYEQHFEYMFVLAKGSPATFNPIRERKLWKDNRTVKAIRREKDGTSDMGYAGKSEYKIIGNVWKYNIGGGHVSEDKIAHEHPAVMPEKLASDHIQTWTNAGDTVLDCFSGSGTTCKMAKELERHYIGIDVNPEYCKIAERRLAQEVMRLSPPNNY